MRSNQTSGRARLAVLALTGLALAGCSGDEDEPEAEETTQAPTAQDRLEEAQSVLVDAGSVSLVMEGTDLPEDQPAYVIGAAGSGTIEPPAFEGDITARLAGIQADVPTIAVDGELYVELPFTPSYVNTDPAELGVPDPARLFSADDGLPSLLSRTEGAEFGDQVRAGSDVLQQVTGTLPGDLVVDLLNTGDREADFDVVYGLVEDGWEVRTVQITGPLYPPAESTYTLTLDDYGVPVEITAP
jgi:lipoprotein LprG